jgi:Na+/proline symporter
MKAVIWTDFTQALMMFSGIVLSIIIGRSHGFGEKRRKGKS